MAAKAGARNVGAPFRAALIIATSLTALIPGSASAALVDGTAFAVDGDTLRVGEATIRLFGIDAPEGRQTCAAAAGSEWACGDAATTRLAQLLSLGPVA